MSMEQKDIAGLVAKLQALGDPLCEASEKREPHDAVTATIDSELLFNTICAVDEAASALTELSSTLAQAEARVKELEGALGVARQALNDWTVSYASEFCSEEHVAETGARISEYGTLAYIAHVQEAIQRALRSQEPASGEAGT